MTKVKALNAHACLHNSSNLQRLINNKQNACHDDLRDCDTSILFVFTPATSWTGRHKLIATSVFSATAYTAAAAASLPPTATRTQIT